MIPSMLGMVIGRLFFSGLEWDGYGISVMGFFMGLGIFYSCPVDPKICLYIIIIIMKFYFFILFFIISVMRFLMGLGLMLPRF